MNAVMVNVSVAEHPLMISATVSIYVMELSMVAKGLAMESLDNPILGVHK